MRDMVEIPLGDQMSQSIAAAYPTTAIQPAIQPATQAVARGGSSADQQGSQPLAPSATPSKSAPPPTPISDGLAIISEGYAEVRRVDQLQRAQKEGQRLADEFTQLTDTGVGSRRHMRPALDGAKKMIEHDIKDAVSKALALKEALDEQCKGLTRIEQESPLARLIEATDQAVNMAQQRAIFEALSPSQVETKIAQSVPLPEGSDVLTRYHQQDSGKVEFLYGLANTLRDQAFTDDAAVFDAEYYITGSLIGKIGHIQTALKQQAVNSQTTVVREALAVMHDFVDTMRSYYQGKALLYAKQAELALADIRSTQPAEASSAVDSCQAIAEIATKAAHGQFIVTKKKIRGLFEFLPAGDAVAPQSATDKAASKAASLALSVKERFSRAFTAKQPSSAAATPKDYEFVALDDVFHGVLQSGLCQLDFNTQEEIKALCKAILFNRENFWPVRSLCYLLQAICRDNVDLAIQFHTELTKDGVLLDDLDTQLTKAYGCRNNWRFSFHEALFEAIKYLPDDLPDEKWVKVTYHFKGLVETKVDHGHGEGSATSGGSTISSSLSHKAKAKVAAHQLLGDWYKGVLESSERVRATKQKNEKGYIEKQVLAAQKYAQQRIKGLNVDAKFIQDNLLDKQPMSGMAYKACIQKDLAALLAVAHEALGKAIDTGRRDQALQVLQAVEKANANAVKKAEAAMETLSRHVKDVTARFNECQKAFDGIEQNSKDSQKLLTSDPIPCFSKAYKDNITQQEQGLVGAAKAALETVKQAGSQEAIERVLGQANADIAENDRAMNVLVSQINENIAFIKGNDQAFAKVEEISGSISVLLTDTSFSKPYKESINQQVQASICIAQEALDQVSQAKSQEEFEEARAFAVKAIAKSDLALKALVSQIKDNIALMKAQHQAFAKVKATSESIRHLLGAAPFSEPCKESINQQVQASIRSAQEALEAVKEADSQEGIERVLGQASAGIAENDRTMKVLVSQIKDNIALIKGNDQAFAKVKATSGRISHLLGDAPFSEPCKESISQQVETLTRSAQTTLGVVKEAGSQEDVKSALDRAVKAITKSDSAMNGLVRTINENSALFQKATEGFDGLKKTCSEIHNLLSDQSFSFGYEQLMRSRSKKQDDSITKSLEQVTQAESLSAVKQALGEADLVVKKAVSEVDGILGAIKLGIVTCENVEKGNVLKKNYCASIVSSVKILKDDSMLDGMAVASVLPGYLSSVEGKGLCCDAQVEQSNELAIKLSTASCQVRSANNPDDMAEKARQYDACLDELKVLSDAVHGAVIQCYINEIKARGEDFLVIQKKVNEICDRKLHSRDARIFKAQMAGICTIDNFKPSNYTASQDAAYDAAEQAQVSIDRANNYVKQMLCVDAVRQNVLAATNHQNRLFSKNAWTISQQDGITVGQITNDHPLSVALLYVFSELEKLHTAGAQVDDSVLDPLKESAREWADSWDGFWEDLWRAIIEFFSYCPAGLIVIDGNEFAMSRKGTKQAIEAISFNPRSALAAPVAQT